MNVDHGTMENTKLVKDIENSPFYRATRRKTALRYKVHR